MRSPGPSRQLSEPLHQLVAQQPRELVGQLRPLDPVWQDKELREEHLVESPPRLLVDPARMSVSVGRINFRFRSLTQHDRQFGADSWDFLFKSKEAPGLSFIFRNDPSNGGGYGYVIDGPAGSGLEPTNGVCNLIDFHKSAMGEFLKRQSNSEGLDWATAAQVG